MLDAITIAVEPSIPSGSPDFLSPREFGHYDRLCQELQAHTSASVTVLEAGHHDLRVSGMLILPYLGPSDDDCVAYESQWMSALPGSRPLLMRALPSVSLRWIEQLRPAGVVTVDRHQAWAYTSDVPRGDGPYRQLYGLKALADVLAPDLQPGHFRTENYCLYESLTPQRLPSVLARYLEAYWRFFSEQPEDRR